MDEIEHTPGPWFSAADEVYQLHSDGRLGRQICDISSESKNIPADARLIAAAPELLEALEAFERVIDIWLPKASDSEHEGECIALHRLRNRALDAIAKAKGASDG